jgi:hypothetical protein
VPAGGRTTEEQIVRFQATPFGRGVESVGCANEKDKPWQKQRLS